ncbi:MAG: mechanosensitive ion channel family protein, partial [Fidelibacterota bacterium]
SIAIVLLLVLLRTIGLRIIWKRTEDNQLRYRWQKTITYISVILGIFIVVRVWFAGIQPLATFLGLITAGLAIALKDLVTGLAGWLFILWRRPFEIGHRIQIGNFRGDVIDIRIFKFSLMEIGNWVDADQSTGRIIHVPNGHIFTEVLANYSQGFRFIWHEIPVLLTFESNWEKGKEILIEIANKHAHHLSLAAEKRVKEASKRFLLNQSIFTPSVFTTVKDSGVLLTIRYLIEPRNRRKSEQSIWEEILKQFSQYSDIDFAYPTQRFYNNLTERKRPLSKDPE